MVGCATLPTSLSVEAQNAELAAAKALFERNIAAIQNKDREAYLSCYRQDERFVRAGPEGLRVGYAEFAEGAAPSGSEAWPQAIEASDLEVRWIAPGVVYGYYQYRVVFDGVEDIGVSERVFLKEGDRWVIAVSTAFPIAR